MLRWFLFVGGELPQSRLRRARLPFLSPAVTSSPGAGEVVLWDGVFGITAQFPAEVQSFRARQRLPLRGSWQSRQALTEGVPQNSMKKYTQIA